MHRLQILFISFILGSFTGLTMDKLPQDNTNPDWTSKKNIQRVVQEFDTNNTQWPHVGDIKIKKLPPFPGSYCSLLSKEFLRVSILCERYANYYPEEPLFYGNIDDLPPTEFLTSPLSPHTKESIDETINGIETKHSIKIFAEGTIAISKEDLKDFLKSSKYSSLEPSKGDLAKWRSIYFGPPEGRYERDGFIVDFNEYIPSYKSPSSLAKKQQEELSEHERFISSLNQHQLHLHILELLEENKKECERTNSPQMTFTLSEETQKLIKPNRIYFEGKFYEQ